MSDTALGPGWWRAADGKWHPPELRPPGIMPGAVESVEEVQGHAADLSAEQDGAIDGGGPGRAGTDPAVLGTTAGGAAGGEVPPPDASMAQDAAEPDPPVEQVPLVAPASSMLLRPIPDRDPPPYVREVDLPPHLMRPIPPFSPGAARSEPAVGGDPVGRTWTPTIVPMPVEEPQPEPGGPGDQDRPAVVTGEVVVPVEAAFEAPAPVQVVTPAAVEANEQQSVWPDVVGEPAASPAFDVDVGAVPSPAGVDPVEADPRGVVDPATDVDALDDLDDLDDGGPVSLHSLVFQASAPAPETAPVVAEAPAPAPVAPAPETAPVVAEAPAPEPAPAAPVVAEAPAPAPAPEPAPVVAEAPAPEPAPAAPVVAEAPAPAPAAREPERAPQTRNPGLSPAVAAKNAELFKGGPEFQDIFQMALKGSSLADEVKVQYDATSQRAAEIAAAGASGKSSPSAEDKSGRRWRKKGR